MSTKTLSRRSAIALVGVSTIAAGAAASVTGAPTRGPIGELSAPELGEQFKIVYERWRVTHLESVAHREEYQSRLFAATGIAFEDSPNYDEEGHAAYRATQDRISAELSDDGHPDSFLKDLNDEITSVTGKIMRLPARSLADLALKARAAALRNQGYWDGDEPMDWGTVAARYLIDDVCALAGVEVLPGVDVLSIEDCMDEDEGD